MAAAAHPRVHSIGNAHPLHAAILPIVWTWIRYAAFAGVDVRARALSELVPREYVAGAVACDLGCSVGHMSRTLRNRGALSVVGVDADGKDVVVVGTCLLSCASLPPPAASLLVI